MTTIWMGFEHLPGSPVPNIPSPTLQNQGNSNETKISSCKLKGKGTQGDAKACQKVIYSLLDHRASYLQERRKATIKL